MQTHHEDRGTSPRTTDYPPPAVPRHLAVPLPVSFRQGRRDPKELISLRIADKCGLCVYLGGLTRLRKRPERRLAQATSGGAPRPQAEPLATTVDETELATTRITATGSPSGHRPHRRCRYTLTGPWSPSRGSRWGRRWLCLRH